MKGFLVSVAAVAALIAAPVHAETFDFSFTNTGGTVSGTVTGEIVGLSDNSTGPATAIYIDSYPSSTGLDLTATTPFNVLTAATNIADNSFTVASGAITSEALAIEFSAPSYSGVYSLILDNSIADPYTGQSAPRYVLGAVGTNSAVITQAPVSFSAATPVPSTLPLLATGLGLLSFLGYWRRKRKVQAPLAA